MTVRCEIEANMTGLERLLHNIDKAQELLTERMLEDDRGNVPVRTGHLRDSGHVAARDRIEYSEHYATYVYNGTRKMKANPWFETTKAEHQDEWAEYVGDVIVNG